MAQLLEPGVPRVARTLNGWMGTGSGPAFVPRLHRWLYLRTGGRLGHGIIGVPSLLLHDHRAPHRSDPHRCARLRP